MECYLPLAGMVDLAAERARLEKEIAEARAEIERTGQLLANPAYVAKAPAAVVDKDRTRLAEVNDRLSRLEERLRGLG